MLDKAQILAADDRKLTSVPCAEWGGDVYIRCMSGEERDIYEGECYQLKGKNITFNRQNVRARLLVRCLCDESGKRLFADADAKELGQKSGRVLDRLFDVAQKTNGLTKADVDDLSKNS